MVVEGEGRGKGRGGICIDLKFSNPFATPVGAGLGWSAWVGGGRRRGKRMGRRNVRQKTSIGYGRAVSYICFLVQSSRFCRKLKQVCVWTGGMSKQDSGHGPGSGLGNCGVRLRRTDGGERNLVYLHRRWRRSWLDFHPTILSPPKERKESRLPAWPRERTSPPSLYPENSDPE